ncbi:PID domain-containing protein [Aphelenchoides fujianensis]|nr:PID domain-containing protein [Aphelenchoides fujianensis]
MTELVDLEGLHRLFYLGVVEITLGVGHESPTAATATAETPDVAGNAESVRSIEERIIDQLDQAQLTNRITRRPEADAAPVAVRVNTNGVKLLEIPGQRVVERLSMHKIVQCLSYENELGSYNVAVVVVKSEGGHQAHLLQTESADEADHLCQQVREAFTELDREANTRAQEERQRHPHRSSRNGASSSSTAAAGPSSVASAPSALSQTPQ